MSEKAQQPALFDRMDVILAMLAGVLALSLYARTLAPGVLPWDSGEFQILAYQVGGLAWVIGRVPLVPIQITLNTILTLAILYIGVLPIFMLRWKAVQQGKLPFLGHQGYIVDGNFYLTYKQVSLIVRDLEPNAIMFLTWGVLYPY